MFTGLIQDLGTLSRVDGSGPTQLEITTGLPTATFQTGESVAVNGVCLTVTRISDGRIAVEAGAETLARTTVGTWAVGRQLHLERALAMGERLGGHLVLGHVDGVGKVQSSHASEGGWLLEVAAPTTVEPFLLSKGSIALDGVSLTLNEVRGSTFSVFLISETMRRTALPSLRPGAEVNLEADILGKYVAKLLGKTQPQAAVTLQALQTAGFV